MRRFIPAASLAAIIAAGMAATVSAESGSSSTATISQSGPGGSSTVTRSTNGSQTVTRRSGNSAATITQGSGPGAAREAGRAMDSIEDKAAERLGCARQGSSRGTGDRAAAAAAGAGVDLDACDPEDDRAASVPIPVPRPARPDASRRETAERLERRMDPDRRLEALDAEARAAGVDLGGAAALRRITREAAR